MLTPEQIANRNKWCDALESDTYSQSTGELHGEDGYCCLGVAEECLSIPRCTDGINKNAYLIPEDAEKTLGLSYDDQKELADKNDEGFTFDDIASWIRESTATGRSISDILVEIDEIANTPDDDDDYYDDDDYFDDEPGCGCD